MRAFEHATEREVRISLENCLKYAPQRMTSTDITDDQVKTTAKHVTASRTPVSTAVARSRPHVEDATAFRPNSKFSTKVPSQPVVAARPVGSSVQFHKQTATSTVTTHRGCNRP